MTVWEEEEIGVHGRTRGWTRRTYKLVGDLLAVALGHLKGLELLRRELWQQRGSDQRPCLLRLPL